MRSVLGALAAGLLSLPLSAWAYRPFDSTDASVAELHGVEVGLSPLSHEHGDNGSALVSPSLRLNYGFVRNWELVIEGEADHFSRGGSQLAEVAISVRSVLREGSLQEKSGVSLASEASFLLPEIGADNGAGNGAGFE